LSAKGSCLALCAQTILPIHPYKKITIEYTCTMTEDSHGAQAQETNKAHRAHRAQTDETNETHRAQADETIRKSTRALWIAIQRGQNEEFERLCAQMYGDKASSITEQEKRRYLRVLAKNDQVSLCKSVMRLLDVDWADLLESAAIEGAAAIVRHLLEDLQLSRVQHLVCAFLDAVRRAHHHVTELIARARQGIIVQRKFKVMYDDCWGIAQTVPPRAYVCTIVSLLRTKITLNDRKKTQYSQSLGRAVTLFPPPSPCVIRCLLRAKANPDTQFVLKRVKCSVLAHAAAAGHLGTVNLLIQFKADVDRAPEARDEEVEAHVFQPGADDWAEYRADNEAAQRRIKEAAQRHGTPLQVATRLKQQDVVFALLSAGASI
jgi:hypothetical protein